MEVLWERGDSTVRDVAPYLGERAYTTVMTTMERLYQKGYLDRLSKRRRGFIYRAKVTREIWEQMAIDSFMDWFRAQSISADVLISCFVKALGAEHEPLLEELEHKIKAKREELQSDRRGSSGAESPS